MQKIIKAGIGIFVLCASVGSAQAGTPKVSSPYIDPHDKIEWQGYYSVDDENKKDDAWLQRVIAGHAVTDYWKIQLKTTFQEQGGDDNADLTSIGLSNGFQFTEKGQYMVDAGLKVDYDHMLDHDKSDTLSAKLAFGKDMQNFTHLFNIRVDHGVGGNTPEGFGGGISWSTKYKYSEALQPGIEIYNEFGSFNKMVGFHQEDRSMGPTIQGKVGDINYQAGYIFGLTDKATDGIFKLSLEYQF